MSARTPTEINERFRDAFNARDLNALLELYEPDALLVPAPEAPDHAFAVAVSKPASSSTQRPQFMIRLFPHRGIDLLKSPTAEERTIMSAHRQYMDMLAGRGQLVLTGLSEEPGTVDGVVIVEAGSEQEAAMLAANDPFVLGGLARAELRPFRTVLMRPA